MKVINFFIKNPKFCEYLMTSKRQDISKRVKTSHNFEIF